LRPGPESGSAAGNGLPIGLRFAALLLLAVVLPFASPAQAMLTLAALIMAALLTGTQGRIGPSLSRLRWLLLSLILAHAALVPGTPVIPQLPGLSREGAIEGLRRCALLAAFVAGTQVLLSGLPIAGVVDSLTGPLKKLPLIGVFAARFALRLGLALDKATELSGQLRDSTVSGGAIERLASLILTIEAAAVPAGGRIDGPTSQDD